MANCGIFISMPSFSADACETIPATVMLSAQAMFNALVNLDDQALANLKPGQLINMFNSVAILSRQDVETRYRKAQLGELMKAFDREAAAKAQAHGGALTGEDLAEIRKAVFGEQV